MAVTPFTFRFNLFSLSQERLNRFQPNLAHNITFASLCHFVEMGEIGQQPSLYL